MRPLRSLALAGAVHALPAAAPVCAPVARAFAIPRTVGSGVALTFDDGPHPAGTPAVLRALDDAGVRATFFLVGEQVHREPALAGEIAAAGHEVALHCHRHRNQLLMAPWQVADDMRRGEDAIAEVVGTAPVAFRPPYGIFSLAGLAIARRRHRPILWSRWGHDWRADATAASIATEAAGGARDGVVILLHDADHYSDPGCWRDTAEAVPRVVELLAGAGLRPGTRVGDGARP